MPGRESGTQVETNNRKETKENMWNEKVSGKINFDEVGQELVGTITEVTSVQMQGGKVNSYTMVTEEGETINFLGTTVLDRLIGHELQSMVKIKYLGITKTASQRNLKNFQVHIWEEDKVEPKKAKK